MKLIRKVALGAWVLAGLASIGAQAPLTSNRWVQPAADLAAQIADILGPGQAQLSIRNISTIQTNEIPAIRKLLEQDLKTHGVLASGAESANAVRVTLSEDIRERLWVAEVMEGSETHVAMVHLDAPANASSTSAERIVLRKEKLISPFELNGRRPIPLSDAVLAVIETQGGLVVLREQEIDLFKMSPAGWQEFKGVDIGSRLQLPRDSRGLLVATEGGNGFLAYTPGVECAGRFTPSGNVNLENQWEIHCHASDDPWPVYQAGDLMGAPPLKAFYNPARNYFTGVVTLSLGVDLPAFYAVGMMPRAAGGAALLLAVVDGKALLVESNAMHTVADARDWGSDFAVVRSGCGAGSQVIATSSGEASMDSLRAFEIPALEAVPVSGPLMMGGTVTALWTAQDGKSALAAVRNPAGEYEVDRVAALCN